MQIQKGYFYFIKDYYYDKVQDKELMQNKENGVKRPCFYCFKDTRVDGLSWFIPPGVVAALSAASQDMYMAVDKTRKQASWPLRWRGPFSKWMWRPW